MHIYVLRRYGYDSWRNFVSFCFRSDWSTFQKVNMHNMLVSPFFWKEAFHFIWVILTGKNLHGIDPKTRWNKLFFAWWPPPTLSCRANKKIKIFYANACREHITNYPPTGRISTVHICAGWTRGCCCWWRALSRWSWVGWSCSPSRGQGTLPWDRYR